MVVLNVFVQKMYVFKLVLWVFQHAESENIIGFFFFGLMFNPSKLKYEHFRPF
jgi:hypothetical protein